MVLSHNHISSLNISILFNSIYTLSTLLLDHNQIHCLPPEIGLLSGLQRLDIQDNLLETLPLSLSNLVRLEWLDISSNYMNVMSLGGLTPFFSRISHFDDRDQKIPHKPPPSPGLSRISHDAPPKGGVRFAEELDPSKTKADKHILSKRERILLRIRKRSGRKKLTSSQEGTSSLLKSPRTSPNSSGELDSIIVPAKKPSFEAQLHNTSPAAGRLRAPSIILANFLDEFLVPEDRPADAAPGPSHPEMSGQMATEDFTSLLSRPSPVKKKFRPILHFDAKSPKDLGEAEYLTLFAIDFTVEYYPFMEATPRRVYEKIMPKSVHPFVPPMVSQFLTTPDVHESPQELAHIVYGKRASNYPLRPDGTREGDPNCDAFSFSLTADGCTLACLTDGCGWGTASSAASTYVAKNVAQIVLSHSKQPINASTRGLGWLLLYAMTRVHVDLADRCDSGLGTTTALAGITVKLSDALQYAPGTFLRELFPDERWYFISVSVGDCKAFLYSRTSRQVTDITQGNRLNLSDPCDPGGRIGLSDANALPDLRNLSLYSTPCVEGDIIVLLTDGIHDNFDPEFLGLPPSDFDMPVDSWSLVDQEIGQFTKQSFMEKIIAATINKCEVISPKTIVQALIDHSHVVSSRSRAFLENSKGRLPPDHRLYPGKMDHSTCVAFLVGSRLGNQPQSSSTH